MKWDVRVERAEAKPLAMITARSELAALPSVLPSAFDELHLLLRTAGVATRGRNVVVYLDDVFNLEVGVLVPADFESAGGLLRSSTPAGLVATTRHVGPYSELPQAHAAVHRSCAEAGRELEGRSWEIYGDWNDDPAELWTDIVYLVQPSQD